MKKGIKSIMALSLAVIMTACGGAKDGGKEAADGGAEVSKDTNAKLSVQVEEAWLPHYEKAAFLIFLKGTITFSPTSNSSFLSE